MTDTAATSKTAEAMTYDGMHTISVPVSNYEASKRWYNEVLGLEESFEVKEIGWCEFKSPTPGLGIGLSAVEKVEAKGGAVPVFGVRNIEQARAHLEAQAVRFDGPTQIIPGMVMLATFYDPDGNAFMLSQNLMQ